MESLGLHVGGRPTCGARKVCLREVNAHLICVLCGGYYIDAVTIGECLHSFCRSCIVKYLETNKFCPICDVQLHKTKPLLSIKTDKILQRLVYKMVPGLYSSEIQRRKNFYSNTELQSSTDSESCDGFQDYKLGHEYFTPEDSISLSLEYYDSTVKRDLESNTSSKEDNKKQVPYRRYLQCPAAVTMNHLKKFVSMKYGLTKDQRVDIIYEDECLPENFSLMDVAYTFIWKRVTPMRFYYRILERSTITTTPINHKITAQIHPTNSQRETSMNSEAVTEDDDVQNQEKSDQSSDGTVQGKRKLKDNSDVSEINSVPEVVESEPPLKKAKIVSQESEKTCDSKNNEIIELDDDTTEGSEDGCSKKEQIKESPVCNVEEQLLQETNETDENVINNTEENVIDEEEEDEEVAGATNMDAEVIDVDEIVQESQDEVNEADDNDGATNGVEAEEIPSEDFILQDDQQIDINDDLEEDDDEDRLRICEEDLSDKIVEDDPVEENLQEKETDEQKVVEEKVEEVPKYNEFKIRKKNKKGKHHHHHRHKRDHPPPPAATILHSSDTKKDIMKLKVKLTAIKQDESAKHYYIDNNYSSPRHHSSKHKSYVICEENDNDANSNQSQENNDDDSVNSQMTDERDADTQSIGSSKGGHGSSEDSHLIKVNSSNHNGNVEVGKNKIRESSSNKEKLLQMRAVRHKNITKHKDVLTSNITKDEVCKPKTQILIPPSSITVSKITAAEKRKMDEEKLLMLSGKNNNHDNDNKRPSLEIMLVNAPNAGSKNCESKINDLTNNEKLLHNNIRNHLPTIPLVRIMKTSAPAPALLQRPPISTSASSKMPNNTIKIASKSVMSTDNKHKLPDTSADNQSTLDKLQSFTQSNEKKTGKKDDFGALDLSGKSSRKSFSASSITQEKINTSNQNVINMAQSLVHRQFSNPNRSPARRSSSNSPSDISGARGSPDPTRTMIPASMWNLMTLSDTAVHIRNMKAAQDGSKSQLTITSHKTSTPNHYPSAPSPSRSPSNGSPTQLKIPVPNLTLNNKLLNKGRPPGNDMVSAGRGRGIAIQNRNLSALKTGSNHDPTRTVRPMSPVRCMSGILNRQNPSSAVAKKQAGINGRLGIPPPPPAIPISSIFKMENMTRKYDIEKVAAGLTVKAAVDAYRGIK